MYKTISDIEQDLTITWDITERVRLYGILIDKLRCVSLKDAQERLGDLRSIADADDMNQKYIVLRASLLVAVDSMQYDDVRSAITQLEYVGEVSGNDSCFGIAQMGYGMLARIQGDIEKAAVNFSKARSKFINDENTRDAVAALINLGIVSNIQGDKSKAIGYYEQAIDECRLYGYPDFEANALTNKAEALYQRGEMSAALEIFDIAIARSEITENIKGKGNALNNKANVLSRIADYTQSFETYLLALECREQVGDKQGYAATLSNIGGLLYLQRKYDDAIEYQRKSLAVFAILGDSIARVNTLLNIGVCYKMQKIYPVALEIYTEALKLAESIGYKRGVATIRFNIGLVHESLHEIDTAVEYMKEAKKLFEELEYPVGIADVLQSLGTVHITAFDIEPNTDTIEIAERYLLEANSMFIDRSMQSYLGQNYMYLHEVYQRKKNFEAALDAFKKYHTIETELFGESQQKRIEQLHTLHSVELLKTEREVSDRILNNILPGSIAERLKQGESVIADKAANVTVLFADIVGFTKLSARVSAEELVRMLNDVFFAFDELAVKYGLEKIKTIGDCYMVVGGLPEARADHAQAVALFAIDMLKALQELPIAAEAHLDIRIGIHSGDVVAGVIGKRKFAYDLWGDTVNTASRMESHGLPGRIHISNDTYQLIRNDFRTEDRGEIEVKGKGIMRTWFVNSRIHLH
ncbi:MAG: tetratricopeptide repeat protein [Candidatus Kapabacteria bacterium]|nr:tetratricopeptide repeat protein [Candidatus Kapabacteria bacterium]